ncbi:ABC transporter substrate-binding protein [Amycolatopsis sp. CA-230715]|uniref:ABC transporter substrate-binding protein n=1 Tax=Amycolatopsis sp. CA-230715 TaxID=2745196 RepID=UPI001C035137|nr:ABC transporter substrate-binding protein [Amycolatopsis sp. CA-230715]QWF84278.1 hypothetical protein HUW46_07728 [Amycolatopsis sp. CA-230715]
MRPFPAFPDRFARRLRSGGPPVRPRSRWYRYRFAALAVVVLLLLWPIIWLRPWERCGDGLHSVDSVCVGLDLESTALREDDPLADLEALIAEHNEHVGPRFKTVVVLENLTTDPSSDSTPIDYIRHQIQGAIAAAWPQDQPSGTKLLLANYGSNAEHWGEAVDEIIAAAESEHIVAVTGIGTSLENTRRAVAALSRQHIPTIGATVTADNMNVDPDGKPIKEFFRVGPTNTDEGHAAVNHVAKSGYGRAMIVADVNESDQYVATLAKSFRDPQAGQVLSTKKFDSPQGKPAGTDRDKYLQQLFRTMHSDICGARPDVIYFAGRGVDVRSFVTALSDDGACEQLRSVTVISGDDTATLVRSPLRLDGDIGVRVLYTALAYPDQWKMFKGNESSLTYETNYRDFENEFVGTHQFAKEHLWDGAAMIEHDAVAAALRAAELDPAAGATTMANFLRSFDCNSLVPGATGFLAFDQDTGNRIDKATPILEIDKFGGVKPIDLVWPEGHPMDTSQSCR